MTDTTEQLDAQITALAVEAFSAFCEDITGMFGVASECTEVRTGSGTMSDIRKEFKKLVSINYVEAKGTLEGNYNLMFDQAGTFIIAGVFVMLPEKRILEYVKSGTSKDTDFINDAIKEVGNLLVGSWDRIYREELEGHEHFKQSGTFIGNITDKDGEKGLSLEEECFYAVCEMEIENFPKFKCSAVFPQSILAPKTDPEPAEDASETAEADSPSAPESSAEIIETPVTEVETVNEPVTESGTESDTTNESSGGSKTEAVVDDTERTKSEEAVVEDAPQAPEPEQPGPVTQAIEQLTALTGGGYDSLNPAQNNLSNISAKQVMNPAVLWADPEDTIEHIIKQMQQHNAGYLLVGKDLQIDGIASKSDIASAVSPYTRSVFSHWRRPLDDASLQIRIKWFMSRPVQTIAPDASLEVVIYTMSKHGIRALPVVDANGLVMGLITVFDIFQALTGKDSLQGHSQQTPPLV